MTDTKKIILVVEDDDMLRSIICNQFLGSYDVISAKDGQQALQLIEDRHPDLIILDLLLPRVDGFEVLDKLRGLSDPVQAKTPVMVVSNLADQESIKRAQQYEIEAYFTKADISLGSLSNMVSRIFREIL